MSAPFPKSHRIQCYKMSTTSHAPATLFQEKHPLLIRVWHILFFLFVLSTIIVVIFAEQVFDTRANAPSVMEEAMDRGVELNEKQARGIAHYFSEKLWVIHTYIGYGITFLLICRLLIEFLVSREHRFWKRLMQALRLKPDTDLARKDRRHYLFVRFTYVVFYILILVMSCTGLGLAFEDMEFFDKIHRPLKEIHEIGQWGIFAFVILHLAGVLIADFSKDKHGIISYMIGGGKH